MPRIGNVTHSVAFLSGLLLLVALAAAHDARAADCKDRKPTTWDIEVAPASEPGERLEVTGQVISSTDRKPLAGVTVYVYHADAKGKYSVAANQPPRLCGILRTNQHGAYRIRTSMPGGYGGFPAHIHYEVWGPRVARQHLFVNLERRTAVRDTSRVPVATVSPRLIGEVRAAITRPVERGADGLWRCVRDLVVGTH